MSDNYEDILNRSIAETPEPKLLPAGGQWLLRVRSIKFNPAKGNSNAFFNFVFNPVQPGDDVDPDDLAELGDYDFTGNTIFHRVYVETNADWAKVAGIFRALGLGDQPSYTEAMKKENVQGAEVWADVGVRAYTRNDGTSGEDNTLSNFTAVE